jgi:hypothetical protein
MYRAESLRLTSNFGQVCHFEEKQSKTPCSDNSIPLEATMRVKP